MHTGFAVGLLAALGASSGAHAATSGSNSSSPLPGQPPTDPHIITAHPDGNCMQSLGAGAAATFNNTKRYPDYNTTTYPVFPGASLKDGGGYDVWFSMGDPEPQCRNIIMVPFTQDTPWANSTVGKQLINAGKAGCYYANIPQDTKLYTSVCCGSECDGISMNSSQLMANPFQKRDSSSDEDDITVHFDQEYRELLDASSEAPAADVQSGSLAGRASAIARRWYYSAPAPPPDCHFITPGQPYSRAGPQVVVSDSQICSQSPCSISVNHQTSYSITATASDTTTITNGFGVEVGVTTGVDFFAKAQFSASAKYDFSKAVATATGQDVMTGNSTTLTYTMPLELGVESMVTFTPTYLCYTGTYDCAANKSTPFLTCFPDIDPQTRQPRGDYNPLSFG